MNDYIDKNDIIIIIIIIAIHSRRFPPTCLFIKHFVFLLEITASLPHC